MYWLDSLSCIIGIIWGLGQIYNSRSPICTQYFSHSYFYHFVTKQAPFPLRARCLKFYSVGASEGSVVSSVGASVTSAVSSGWGTSST